ncbi:MAG: type I restriction endonuclease [Veillonellaceae bacterium]|nr:type I restriction endonuclease [Veillonellaceae bacterium]
MSQSQKEAKERQKELEFEKDLINFITSGEFVGSNDNELSKILVERHRWIYEKKIKTTKALWDNFRQILYEHNQDILKEPLSDMEFAQVKRIIEDLHTPYEAGQFLYGINGISQVEIDLDNGRHVYLTVFDQKQVGAGNTVYQVVTQIERPSKISGRENRRFDTTLLINGLPIIQIEEKIDGDKINEALNQMQQYIEERQYTDIFSTLQILVAMTPNCIKYMANTTAEDFNSDFAFEWQNPKTNKTVYRWEEFANFFLTIPMAHKMATSYMILDGTKNRQSLKGYASLSSICDKCCIRSG